MSQDATAAKDKSEDTEYHVSSSGHGSMTITVWMHPIVADSACGEDRHGAAHGPGIGRHPRPLT